MKGSAVGVITAATMQPALKAASATGYETLVVAGGVAANRKLRERLAQTPLTVKVPPLSLATDNGAMIALAAHARLEAGLTDAETVDATPYLPLSEVSRDLEAIARS